MQDLAPNPEVLTALPEFRATPDGALVHHFPTPEDLAAQFSAYNRRRLDIIQAPIPFMGGVKMPQLVFWGEKPL